MNSKLTKKRRERIGGGKYKSPAESINSPDLKIGREVDRTNLASKKRSIEVDGVRSEVVRIISKMLDNPDEYEIYPTTRCYDELEDFISQTLLSQKQSLLQEIREWAVEVRCDGSESGGIADGYNLALSRLLTKLNEAEGK